MHLVCAKCAATNRVPEDRLQEGPKCGRCGAQLAAAEPVALDEKVWSTYIARSEMPVLVDFWADWCGPCKQMAPHFAAAARQLPAVRFAKIDTDAVPVASAQYGIRSIPTMILFRSGREIARMSGAVSAGQLQQWVGQQLAQQT